MSKPIGNDIRSELISASSCLNTEDTRKPYTGTFLSDEIPEVKQAQTYIMNAFNAEETDTETIIFNCNKVIEILKLEVQGGALNVTHSLLNHAIEHIESAIDVARSPKPYIKRCGNCPEAKIDKNDIYQCSSIYHTKACSDIPICLDIWG